MRTKMIPEGKPDKNILWEAIYGNWYTPPKIKDGKVLTKKPSD